MNWIASVAERIRPKRGAAWAARMHALIDDYRCCIACGMVGAPAFKCPGGIHCYCAKCGPGPACECQPEEKPLPQWSAKCDVCGAAPGVKCACNAARVGLV
jgi:hypothetical protein